MIASSGQQVDPELVREIARSQTARGPDNLTVSSTRWSGYSLVLGHNRLSIIDLSEQANQPMSLGPGDLEIVFNGELYNYLELREELRSCGHRFQTESDTEVVLRAWREWGVAALSRFIGMFAFALHDPIGEALHLVRDRFGVKPLFVFRDRERVIFASTPEVIARRFGLPPSLRYCARGVRFKFYEDDSEISPYDGIEAVASGTMLTISCADGASRVDSHRWYDLKTHALEVAEGLAGTDARGLQARVMDILGSACELRCRSDVPVGLSVSGGVDSSIVASLMAQGRAEVRGYSYAHPDFPHSEGPLVAALARHIPRLDPRWVWVDDPDDIERLFWRTLKAQDAPFPHVSIMAQHAVFEAARKDGTVVLLGGQGGDEGFMGYRKFFLFYTQSVLRGRDFARMPALLASLVPFSLHVARRAGVFLSERKRYGRGGGMASALRLPGPETGESMGLPPDMSMLDRQVLDVTRYSLPTLLRYEDRNSMGNSVETRLPFMDQRVLALGLAIPTAMKLNRGLGKWVLRAAARGRIPDAIRLNGDKRGFDVRQRLWIEGRLGEVLRRTLSSQRSTLEDILPANARISEIFSDARLVGDPQAFKEAVTATWIASRR